MNYLRKLREQKERFRQGRLKAISMVGQMMKTERGEEGERSPRHRKFPSTGSQTPFPSIHSLETDLKRHLVGFFNDSSDRFLSHPTPSPYMEPLYERDSSPLRSEAYLVQNQQRIPMKSRTWDLLLRQKAAEKQRKSPTIREEKKGVNIHVKRAERKSGGWRSWSKDCSMGRVTTTIDSEGSPRLSLVALAPVSLRFPSTSSFPVA